MTQYVPFKEPVAPPIPNISVDNFSSMESWLHTLFGLENRKIIESDSRGIPPLIEYSLELPNFIDPFKVFDQGKDEWKVFWKGKNEEQITVGIGSATSIILNLGMGSKLPKDSSLKWFGGIPFHDSSSSSELWGEFADSYFFIPRFEWQYGNKSLPPKVFVRENFNSLDDLAEITSKLKSEFIKKFAEILNSTRRLSLESVPKILETQDYPTFSNWKKILNDAKNSIQSGEKQKIVLSRKKRLVLDRTINPNCLLHFLNDLNTQSYLFAIASPSGRIFLGCSPERLIKWQGSQVEMDAMAGTSKVSQNQEINKQLIDSLSLSSKDLLEHRAVSFFIDKILSKFCTEHSQVIKEKILTLKSVQHIVSKFSGKLKSFSDPLDLLFSLHPTPAVGGLPQKSALSFIREKEPIDRGWFSGPIGYFSENKGDFAIGIRSSLIYKNIIEIFAGAGVIEESDPLSEWQETEIKMKNFLDIFGIEAD